MPMQRYNVAECLNPHDGWCVRDNEDGGTQIGPAYRRWGHAMVASSRLNAENSQGRRPQADSADRGQLDDDKPAPITPDAEIRYLNEALETHKIMLSESSLREGRLLNALHEIADLDKHGGYNTACDKARRAIAANR